VGQLVFLALIGLGAGLSIGCIGIGGVVLVSGLHYLGGIAIPTAIAAAMMGYLLTGLVGTVVYARLGSIRWAMAGWLCAGAMPSALAGAWLSNTVPSSGLEIAIGALTLGSGAYALSGEREGGATAALGRGTLVGIGSVTGVLSALTGTGGPLVLVPLMLWLQVPVLTAIGLSQAVQLPIAALATVGNFAFGKPEVWLGAVLGVALAGGAFLGARLAHKAPHALLKRIVAAVLIVVGAAILGGVALDFMAPAAPS
jgi:uncharacterized protein